MAFTSSRAQEPKDLVRMSQPNRLSWGALRSALDSPREQERMRELCLSFCDLYMMRLNLPRSQCLTACESPIHPCTETLGNKNTFATSPGLQTFAGPSGSQYKPDPLPSTPVVRPNS